jgi:hypothetical protein
LTQYHYSLGHSFFLFVFFFVFFNNTQNAAYIDGDRHLLYAVFVVFLRRCLPSPLSSFAVVFTPSSIAAAVFATNALFKQIHVVVVARITHHFIAVGATATNELACIFKSVVAVATQAKIELFAFLGAFLFREVHIGDMNALFFFVVIVVVRLRFKYGFLATSNQF